MKELRPEGPYDTLSQRPLAKISNTEFSRFLDFVEKFEDVTEEVLSMRSGYREMRMMVHLIRNHILGRMTTATSLAANSGLSYGTAMRGIDSLIERGMFIRRPRTPTGKSFSLHPSQKLLSEWESYAHRMKSIQRDMIGMSMGDDSENSFSMGASFRSAGIIPPPAALPERLSLKGNLRLLIHADPTFMAMHNLKRQIEMNFGVGIKNKAMSIDGLRDEIKANARLENSKYDIIACDLPWFGEFAAKGILLPLNQFFVEGSPDLSDFHPEALASTKFEDQQFGIPVQTTPELMCYRRDMFEQAGLEPPTTIRKTLDAAKRLHNPAEGIYGIAWNAARGTPLGHSFAFMMAAFGQPIVNLHKTPVGFDYVNVDRAQCHAMFLSDAAFQTVEYMRELLSYSPPDILSTSWYRRARYYADGHAAMAYCYTLLAPLFALNKESPARDQTEYLPHPVGPQGYPIAPIGGYALAIPANLQQERRDAVWTALRHMTSANMTKLYILNGSLVSPRFSVSNDPEVSSISPLISVVDKMAREGLLQTWPRPPLAEISDIIAIAGAEIHDILVGQKTVKRALIDAQDKADKLMKTMKSRA